MLSSVMNRLQDRRDAAADLGEDAGFTLIELMVVLLILAILLAIAIPTFLGVTGGANDRAAQSNLNTALTTVKTAATQNGQQYAPGVTVAILQTNEPSLKWVDAATVSTQGPVSVYFSTDGNGAVLASYSKNNNTCWYAVDNLSAVKDTNAVTPYGASPGVAAGDATHVPSQAGTWYASGTGTCTSAAQPTAASAWASKFG
jgi:type IV pilus assembly protein PilA